MKIGFIILLMLGFLAWASGFCMGLGVGVIWNQ